MSCNSTGARWLCVSLIVQLASAAPLFIEEQFELPKGFRIYKAAGPELTGGSYDIVFDGDGRLLVGDGNAVRRLADADEDGVFDSYEIVATGLGWRGPQGMLVYGDRLYAVGGDGVQVFEGYTSGGALRHAGRIGEKFSTGGDHDGHTLLRGFDGHIYFMAGNGAGLEGRRHITRSNSPVMFEREACVFRFNPPGTEWECIASGGRNPPSLGLNYLGDFFSFDSDMEWHVGLPFWRPVRLNHWIVGGDQGWHEVGASPNHYIDCLASVVDVGRGSPNWGVFYEHNQLPRRYRNAFLVCDYRWKSESTDEYASSGRLVSFFLTPDAGSYEAKVETVARPKARAVDLSGKLISFALVDIEVARDGSLLLSDHNQGIWRIVYDPEKQLRERAPIRVPSWEMPKSRREFIERILTLPQPASEWSRRQEELIATALRATDGDWRTQVEAAALESARPLDEKLRAVRLLSRDFKELSAEFIAKLAQNKNPELRGQSAWLLGLREAPVEVLLKLVADKDAFVRRKALEALNRVESWEANEALIERLNDEHRKIRYAAMTALSKRPTPKWINSALKREEPQVLLRALVAAHLRKEPAGTEVASKTISRLLHLKLDNENQIDLLRVLAIYQKELKRDDRLNARIASYLLSAYPARDAVLRWEQTRMLGAYKVEKGIPRVLKGLLQEKDYVTQFHIAQALAALPDGWSDSDERRYVDWLIGTQQGWFAEFEKKGVEFPMFLSTMLAEAAAHHKSALDERLDEVKLTTLLGGIALNMIAKDPDAAVQLARLYQSRKDTASRLKLADVFERTESKQNAVFLTEQYQAEVEPRLRAALLRALARQDSVDLSLLKIGLRGESMPTIRACAEALARRKAALDKETARILISQLAVHPQIFQTLESVLVQLSSTKPPHFRADAEPDRRPPEEYRNRAREFWGNWYHKTYGENFASLFASAPEKPDQEIHGFILRSSFTDGNRTRGRRVYERLQCNSCHAGGETPGQEGSLFGPDLTGAAQRLSRSEFADALVYPSKQVADRFKATVVDLKNGTSLTGFLTERSAEKITLATQQQVQTLGVSEVDEVRLQDASLMPQGLLNRLSWDELSDLLTFLNVIGTTR